jgi:hypothetical protein
MSPKQPLPLPKEFSDVETYITSLLKFSTTSNLLQTLCGGVHILDFFTRKPDLYSQILPETWRTWFKSVDIYDILDLLMREDLNTFSCPDSVKNETQWRNGPFPPSDLLDYIKEVRKHLLDRTFTPPSFPEDAQKQDKKILVGMNVKKAHEVENFARYINNLTSSLNSPSSLPSPSLSTEPSSYSSTASHNTRKITHLVDFGAGQNYLGRALASAPYNQHIIAIESRPHVVEGARKMDVAARLTERDVVMVNKKAWRARGGTPKEKDEGENIMGKREDEQIKYDGFRIVNDTGVGENPAETGPRPKETVRAKLETPQHGQGTVQYVEHRIQDGNLTSVIDQIEPTITHTPQPKLPQMSGPDEEKEKTPSPESIEQRHTLSYRPPKRSEHPAKAIQEISSQREDKEDPSIMIISLHSCGNLLHHGLRTITLNPTVQAVALVGCCYNLMTERLGPPTFKIPGLRADHPRLESTGNTCDFHGFPMSERLLKYRRKLWRWSPGGEGVGNAEKSYVEQENTTSTAQAQEDEEIDSEDGVRMNITARMMAVQAPQNWSESDSASFFKRHFYRALLQRIFLDKGVVKPPTSLAEGGGRSPAGTDDGEAKKPIVIGTMGKKCYVNFVAYVRGAIAKIAGFGGEAAEIVQEKLGKLTDEEILSYEETYQGRKKELSIVWSLMAFSAGVMEAMIVVDRWLWLKEQECIGEAWVEPVFDYTQSPRNLVVVGIKR